MGEDGVPRQFLSAEHPMTVNHLKTPPGVLRDHSGKTKWVADFATAKGGVHLGAERKIPRWQKIDRDAGGAVVGVDDALLKQQLPAEKERGNHLALQLHSRTQGRIKSLVCAYRRLIPSHHRGPWTGPV